MSIKPLSDDTIRSLCSQVAINSSSALVKELVDNAIDAQATRITINISKNTVDKIEVHDNGHGISPDDFASLGRHGHTSKLRKFEDLHRLGGTTLGFRGEALAAANDLGKVTVTTKTSEETVGSVLHLQPRVGGVQTTEHKAFNIGTTITVTDFLSTFLPRRARAIKDAAKEIAKVKDILIAHALARPQIRFELKILPSQVLFSYNPQSGWDAKGAACIIFRDLSFQCLGKSTSRYISASIEGTTSHGRASTPSFGLFEIQACIPKPDAIAAQIYNKGTFISIDSRPVSGNSGTPRKLVNIFRKYLCAAVPATSSGSSGKPFLQMNIKCPPASYDPNIESAKDDVLFSDETVILELFESLCREVYGLPDRQAQPSRATEPPQLSRFERELLDEHISEDGQEGSRDRSATPDIAPVLKDRKRPGRVPRRARMSDADAVRGFTVNMDAPVESSDEEDEIEESDEEEDVEEPETSSHAPASTMNPWTIARMAPQRHPAQEPVPAGSPPPQDFHQVHAQSNDNNHEQDPPILYQYGMSPRATGFSSSPLRPGRGGGRPTLKVPGGAYRNPRVAAAQLTANLLLSPEQSSSRPMDFLVQQFTPPSSSPRGGQLRGGRANREGRQGQHVSQPQIEHEVAEPHPDGLRQTTIQLGRRPRIIHSGLMGSDDDEPEGSRVSLQPRREAIRSSPRRQMDTGFIMNDEGRRSSADMRHRGLQFSPTANTFSPRQTHLDLTPLGRQVEVLPPGARSSRRRSMSPDHSGLRQQSISSVLRRRSRSRRRSMSRALSMSDSGITLERSPVEERIQNIVQHTHIDVDALAESMWIMHPFDGYLQGSNLGEGLDDLSVQEIELIEHNLKHVLLSKCAPEIAEEVQESVETIDLVRKMKGKGKQVAI